jgi:hypothetical protein
LPLTARILPRLKAGHAAPNYSIPSEGRGAGGDIGSGSGDIGKGAGKAAKGVGKGAGDLVTLHPVGAAENVGKGTGKLIAKLFHHSKKNGSPDALSPSGETPR